MSLLILFTLARSLDQAAYAAYVSLQAIVMLIGSISTVGIQSILQRFLAELRSVRNNVLVYRFITLGIMLRYFSAFVITWLVIFLFPKFVHSLDTKILGNLFMYFLLIGTLRVTSLTVAQAFDSLLWQRVSQLGQVSANVFRIAFLILIIGYDDLTLTAVILIELGAELVFIAVLSAGYYMTWRNDESKDIGDLSWWPMNQSRVVRYGFSRYLANLSRVLYGGAPNRLVVAQFMPIKEVAIFGFADSILNLARRFAPVALMLGFIRPIFVSRYTLTKDFSSLVKMSDIIFRINMFILMLLIVLLASVGEPLLDILSGSKYGQVSLLLAGLFGLLIVEGFRLNLELLIEVTELNSISIISNLVQSFSLFLAIPLFHFIGLWAIVVANISGTLMACVICIYQLYKNGYSVRFSKQFNMIIIVNAVSAYLLGRLFYQYCDSIVLTSIVIGVIYLFFNLLLRPLDKGEVAELKNIIAK